MQGLFKTWTELSSPSTAALILVGYLAHAASILLLYFLMGKKQDEQICKSDASVIQGVKIIRPYILGCPQV